MKKSIITIAAAVCMAAVLTACGGSQTKTETTAAATENAGTEAASGETSAEGSEAATEAAGGKLIMVTNAEFPPYEFRENNDIVGIDADIARAIAEKLGMELEIQDMAFDFYNILFISQHFDYLYLKLPGLCYLNFLSFVKNSAFQ